MSGAVIALVAAVVGVTGTLLAPLLAQRSQEKALRADFARQQEAARVQWDREEARAEFTQRRACYVATNAAFRRYRIELMKYLFHVRQGDVDDAAREALESARHAHHTAFAEAQMMASTTVLDQLDQMARALAEGYRKTKCLEDGTPDPDGSFEEIQGYLQRLWGHWDGMRNVMRRELGLGDTPALPPPGGSA